VYAIIQPEVMIDEEKVVAREIMNPPGVFQNGQRVREITTKDLLPLSGKLLPEFDKRRTIKDMFRKKEPATPSLLKTESTDMNDLSKALEITDDDKAIQRSPEFMSTSKWTPSASQVTEPSPLKSANGKRTPGISKGDTPPAKRQRSSISNQKNKNTGQQTLQSFFQPKQAKKELSGNASSNELNKEPEVSEGEFSFPNGSQMSPKKSPTQNDIETSVAAEIMDDAEEEKFIDPFTTRSEWTKLFSKQAPPRCEGHKEPCTSLQTKVKGPNCGRWFWICAR
jgi:AP endonuclease-2